MVKMNFKTNKLNFDYSEEEDRVSIDPDKIKQFIAMIGGFISSVYLALNASGIHINWLHPKNIEPWMQVFNTGIPILFIIYGIWKNTFILTNRSREQEMFLKQSGRK